jgi:NADP-dependent 3-hydroxy acid dehydrogenase YdfG
LDENIEAISVELTPDDFAGVPYGIAAALPHMKQQKAGHIINVSSVVSLRSVPASQSMRRPSMPCGLSPKGCGRK